MRRELRRLKMKAKIYCVPEDYDVILRNKEELKRITGCEIEVYKVKDAN